MHRGISSFAAFILCGSMIEKLPILLGAGSSKVYSTEGAHRGDHTHFHPIDCDQDKPA